MQSDEFKAAVGKYPTGITIVSTKHDNRFYGFTANSFTSVSLDPALISFCLNVKSASFDAFFNTKYFAINILSNYQIDLATRFASSNIDTYTTYENIINKIISTNFFIKSLVIYKSIFYFFSQKKLR